MDEIEELKRALELTGQTPSESQLRQLSRELDMAAEFLLDLYAHERSRRPSKRETPGLTESRPAIG